LTDIQIIDLYFERSETAINETAKQYGSYCTAIAMNILHNKEDSEECVNDTYLKTWNSIPPQRPTILSSFLGRITRNLSLNKYEARKAKKRGGDEITLLLSELELCIPSVRNVESEADNNDLNEAVNSFLDSIKQEDMIFFMRRYWHVNSVPEIAKQFNVGESKVKMSLHRTRKKLRIYLEERGIAV
jgi:RNA polymerase sigma-70 factor (ECF subfamily)